MSRNYYEILEILPYSNLGDIKKAYHRLAFLYHPDLNPDNPLSEEYFKEINKAYETLKDKKKRIQYDLKIKKIPTRKKQYHEKNSIKIVNEFLNEFWEGFYDNSYKNNINAPKRGEDIRLNLKLAREKTIKGGEIQIEIPNYFSCPNCGKNGTPVSKKKNCQICIGRGEIMTTKKLSVEIPIGAETGKRLKIIGKGKPGLNCSLPGDLYIVLNIYG